MKELQEKVRVFCEKNNLSSPIEHRMLDLVSETGEVAKEILKMTDYGKKEAAYREEVADELGDVLYSLMTVANELHVDLEEALKRALEKYEKRLAKGSPGSEHDRR